MLSGRGHKCGNTPELMATVSWWARGASVSGDRDKESDAESGEKMSVGVSDDKKSQSLPLAIHAPDLVSLPSSQTSSPTVSNLIDLDLAISFCVLFLVGTTPGRSAASYGSTATPSFVFLTHPATLAACCLACGVRLTAPKPKPKVQDPISTSLATKAKELKLSKELFTERWGTP